MKTTLRRLAPGFLPVLFLCAALQLSGCASGQLRPRDQRSIAGKTFVITGASSGFGRGVALELASHGANVVLAARRTELLEEVAAEAKAAGGTPLVVTTDVGKAEDVQRLAEAAVGQFGRIDVWINNAGVGAIGRFWDIPLEDHSRLIDVNLKGVIYGSHAALRQFRTQGGGTLVNIGSIDSEVPHAYHGSYSASKAAVLSLGRSLREELRLNDLRTIKVATVLPWATDTPWWEHAGKTGQDTPKVPLMDEPRKVIHAIIRASLHPREEHSVGWKGKAAYGSHQILPNLTERLTASFAHKYEIEKPPPAPPTSGTLHEPMESGTTVDGGLKEQRKKEKEAPRPPREPALR